MSATDLSLFHAVLEGEADPNLLACEARLRAAQLAGDAVALDGLLADNLLFTGPDGALATKAEDLELHRSGTVRFQSHEPLALRFRLVGADVVMAALLTRLRVMVAGQLVAGTYRYTRVWAREGNAEWRVVGGHVSAVPGA